MKRGSGVLMPIFSIPSKYGIGDFGKNTYKFIDFLKKGSQKYWQILPLVQTGFGNSPYSSVSSHSFNPYFISLETLYKEGLLTKCEIKLSINEDSKVDYDFLYNVRFPLLRTAYARFDKTDNEFINFVESEKYSDYALFMSLKEKFNGARFFEWPSEFKNRDKVALANFKTNHKEEYLFWQFVQFTARKQWFELKDYANGKGISLIGDLPLYVALDSVDVWVNPKLYKLDDEFKPTKVAGVPPDYFCKEGQLWGNPVYEYQEHKKDNFTWWASRIEETLKIYDYVRIDHFRGLDRYYEVDADAQNAIEGEWVDVPEEMFEAIHERVDSFRIIAEDLGVIDDGVRELLAKLGYPGMKILSFAFNGDEGNSYLPEVLNENCVCYTGTHDNDTLIGLISSANEWDKRNLYDGVKGSLSRLSIEGEIVDDISLAKAIIELGYKSKANLFIIPMQDILLLGSEFRINQPGLVGVNNWSIRFNAKHFHYKTRKYLRRLTKKYFR